MLEGRPPVRTIMGYSLVVDERGEEMHKSKGNAIWFSEAAQTIGADPVRWLSVSQPINQPLRFGFGRAEEVQAWLRTLWNVYSFLATYANVDGWPPEGVPPPAEVPGAEALDRWLRARLAAGAAAVGDALESHDPPRAAAALLDLLDDLSNWWVRRSRRRFWRGGSDEDKRGAYAALYVALETLARLLAPIVPFTAEALYQRLRAPFGEALPESVHLCLFPDADVTEEGAALLEECARARAAIGLGRAARAEAGLRVRQPLAAARVLTPEERSPFPHFERDVLEELNVRRLDFVTDRAELGDAVAEEGGLAVGLDTELTEDLLREGIARDLVRHIQNLRKAAQLRVDQRIRLWVEADGQVEAALRAHQAYLAGETLATEVHIGPPPPDAQQAQARVAGQRVTLGLSPCDAPGR